MPIRVVSDLKSKGEVVLALILLILQAIDKKFRKVSNLSKKYNNYKDLKLI